MEADGGQRVQRNAAIAAALLLLGLLCNHARAGPLVYNGSFEVVRQENRAPDGWVAQGNPAIEQLLRAVTDPLRGRVAELTCTRFLGGSPDSHVMLAQLNRVAVKRGQWYRVSLFARASGLDGRVVEVALMDRRAWRQVGLRGQFAPSQTWRRFEFAFRAPADLDPENSRLQVWFTGTGTLWVDDVKMEQTSEIRREWWPALDMTGVRNALPNSSFECGGSGWGCWSPGIPGWGGEVFRRMGEMDESQAFHSRRCWKLSLSADDLPVLYWDYYEPLHAQIRCLLLGHEGWVRVERGQSYVFSAYARADRPGLPVRMVIRQADGPSRQRTFAVSNEWQRLELSFTAERDFACGFVGLDLTTTDPPDGALQLDALQWERGTVTSPYQPRQELESCIETDATGNIFTEPGHGLSFRLNAYNNKSTPQTLRGTLTLTDFLDRVVWQDQVELPVPAAGTEAAAYSRVAAGLRGFFRLRWEPQGGMSQGLRCAVIDPSTEEDSLFGMNHAFSWEFLLRLSHSAGIRWWRDWSVKWQTVQPRPDGFDFRIPDAQINRVLDADGRALVLFPFPSAVWATKPDMEQVEAYAGTNRSLKERLPTAFKPENLEDFATYIRTGVAHYSDRVRHFEILNEPLFTSYALPARFGYDIDDYLDLLRTAYEAAKSADPDCIVIGGISAPPENKWVGEFIEKDGLRWCDVANYHLYAHGGWAEVYEEGIRAHWEEMERRGQQKPIWLTEFGLYADDEPAFTPFGVGDDTMTSSMRPSELTASADLVRFAAIFCAYGVRKIFYHAGTCAALNRSSAGNMFFKYGGAPYKQYAAQATLSRMLGPDVEFVRKWKEPEWLRAYEFRSRGRGVVVAWTRQADSPVLQVPEGLTAFDLMGNALPEREVPVGEIPIYLLSD